MSGVYCIGKKKILFFIAKNSFNYKVLAKYLHEGWLYKRKLSSVIFIFEISPGEQTNPSIPQLYASSAK